MKMTKGILLTTLALLLVTAVSLSAGEEKWAKLKQELNLTDSQVAQLEQKFETLQPLMDKGKALKALPLFTVAIPTSGASAENFEPETIIALERAALDRWGNGDPHGYLETYAPDVTYFDPQRQGRVDGLGAMKELLVPITGKIKIDHYEMIGPKVQHRGDIAVLSFNLVSYAKRPNGGSVIVRWNSTEVYGRIEGKWKIIHSHWSYTKPELKQAIRE